MALISLFFTHIILRYNTYSSHSRPMTPEEKRFAMMGLFLFAAIVGVVISWFILRRLALQRKKKQVQKFIHEFEQKDPFWNEQDMQIIATDIFSYVQTAWEKQSFYYVTNLISDELKGIWETKWALMNEKGYAFHYAHIDITSVTIVGAEDSSDNNKDNFSVEISGYMKRYFYHAKTRQPLYKNSREIQHVRDLFVFERRSNKWLLNRIDYNADLLDVLKTEVKSEKPSKPKRS